VERGNAFGLVSHKGSLAVRSGFLDRLLHDIAKRAKTPAMNSPPALRRDLAGRFAVAQCPSSEILRQEAS
jgi:hypothetical protein